MREIVIDINISEDLPAGEKQVSSLDQQQPKLKHEDSSISPIPQWCLSDCSKLQRSK